jgi:hypothetical protein
MRKSGSAGGKIRNFFLTTKGTKNQYNFIPQAREHEV